MSFHTGQTFTFGETPSATKWGYLWENDYALADGTGIEDDAIITRHILDNNVTSEKLKNTIGFMARRTTDFANVVTGTVTIVPLTTEDFDTGADFDNATNYRFTAPVAGIYHFAGAAQIDAPGAAISVYIYKNGVNVAQATNFTNTASDDLSGVISATISLAATDYVDFRAVHFAGVNRTLLGSAVGANFMSGFLVGRT